MQTKRATEDTNKANDSSRHNRRRRNKRGTDSKKAIEDVEMHEIQTRREPQVATVTIIANPDDLLKLLAFLSII